MVKLTHFDINQITPFSVGFDRVFDRLVDYGTTYETGGFPPYNIRKTDDFRHVIEIALAGFSKDEIEVVLTDGVLVVKSADLLADKDPNEGLVHKGIAKRAFTRKFTLADDIEIKDAKLKNGLLEIELEQIVPEHKKPKVIKVK
jgi:molecular chaperone IbpA|tara:strand:+ start:1063 stop:1494 length:432 start_codon:yes stop_codon:yes gene_type:complete